MVVTTSYSPPGECKCLLSNSTWDTVFDASHPISTAPLVKEDRVKRPPLSVEILLDTLALTTMSKASKGHLTNQVSYNERNHLVMVKMVSTCW
jgi:hypothetical protein